MIDVTGEAAEDTAGTDATTAPVASEPTPTVDRRSLLRRPWAALLAVAGGGAVLAACDITSSPFRRSVHMVRRLTYGVTPATRIWFEAHGEAAWLDEQLDPARLNTSAVDSKLASFRSLSMTAPELLAAYPDTGSAAIAAGELRIAAVIRAVESPAQLFERMVEFWSDHFNVTAQGRVQQLLKIVEDRDVMRTHALGRFKDLLVADASSPAMLLYLDNYLSKVGAINENYARELLELHTLGHDNGYVYDDIVNTARLFTGWSIDSATQGGFLFRTANHDTGPITIMGWTRPSTGSGYDHGVDFLHWLAMRPQTAEHVCRKLAVRFVADDPDPALITAMTNAWLSNDSRIIPVLRAMVAHPAFNSAAGKKFNRPLDYIAQMLRALDARMSTSGSVTQYQAFGRVLSGLGQVPFSWPAPNGFPDTEPEWLSTGGLIARWNFVGDVLAGAYPTITFDGGTFRSGLDGRTAAEIYDRTAEALVLETMTDVGRSFLNTQTGWTDGYRPTAAEINAQLPVIGIAILASPDAQYR